MLNLSRHELEQLRNNNMIVAGGEAEILDYGDKVIKAFLAHQRTVQKEKKIKALVKANLPLQVIKADDIVTVNSEFVGYLMPKVKGENPIHLLTDPTFLKKGNYTIPKLLDMVEQLLTIANTIHQEGFIMGDVSDFNFLIHQKKVYFIDTDSYLVVKHPEWDSHVFSPKFTPPEAYHANGSVHQTVETDYFALAVLAFMILTRVHPFGGIYKKDKRMDTKVRIMQKLSVLGQHDIGILKSIPSWKWMSPPLLHLFYEIFEHGKRVNVLPEIQELKAHLAYCDHHKEYYYSKYSACPICSQNASVITKPKIHRQQTDRIRLVPIFEDENVDLFITNTLYLSKDHHIVNYLTKLRGEVREDYRTEFTADGNEIIYIGVEDIQVYERHTHQTFTIEKKYGSHVQIVGNTLYYVDPHNMLVERSFKNNTKYQKPICRVYNAIFEIASNGEKCLISCYPKRAVVMAHHRCFEFAYENRIRKYALNYDEKLNKWLFVYQKRDGSYRTMVFGEKRIEVDNTTLTYHTEKLFHLAFDQGRIFEPADGKILKYDYKELVHQGLPNVVEFPCSVVQEDSMLQFSEGTFTIVTKEKVYHFGK